jgi:hypothetical protein
MYSLGSIKAIISEEIYFFIFPIGFHVKIITPVAQSKGPPKEHSSKL